MLSRNDLKLLTRLQQKKYRKEAGRFLVEGPRPILEALQSEWHVEKIFHTQAFQETRLANEIFETAHRNGTPCARIPQTEFNRLSATMNPQGVIALIRNKQNTQNPVDYLKALPKALIVAIERLQDPGNLGTIIRTAEWLGAEAMVLGRACVDWQNPKALRASMGASFHIPIFEVDFLPFLQEVKKTGCTIYAADQHGDFPYATLRYSRKNILLLGDETHGISVPARGLADHNVVIPKRGKGESLNVAIAAAILIAEMVK